MILQKRNDLEKFLREQLIGPGGCNFQFTRVLDKSNEDDQELDFNPGEVINTSPGSIYSSAILFPPKASEDEQQLGLNSPQEDEETFRENDDSDSESAIEDNYREDVNFDHTEDIDALGRRFPNRFGISCCLKEENVNYGLRIVINGRFYRKIDDILSVRTKLIDPDGMIEFIHHEEFINQMGEIVDVQDGTLKLNHVISLKDLGSTKERLRELNKFFCKVIATNEDGTLCPIFNHSSFKPEFRFLSAYKERLFAKLNHFDLDGNYTCVGQTDYVKRKIELVEKYETYFSYIDDFLSACDKKSYGFWQSYDFMKEIDLSKIDLTAHRVFRANDYPELKDVIRVEVRDDVYLSLDVWLQAIKKDNCIYLKILLVNNSTPVTSSDVKFFSIVTERVNERCFFGISVDVTSPNLVEYHKKNDSILEDKEANSLKFLSSKTVTKPSF